MLQTTILKTLKITACLYGYPPTLWEFDDEGSWKMFFRVTPLGWATKYCDAGAVEMLVQRGADASLGDGLFMSSEGNPYTLTMFHVAESQMGWTRPAREPSPRLVAALLNAGDEDREWWGGMFGHECWSAFSAAKLEVFGDEDGHCNSSDEEDSMDVTDLTSAWGQIYTLMAKQWCRPQTKLKKAGTMKKVAISQRAAQSKTKVRAVKKNQSTQKSQRKHVMKRPARSSKQK
eukprot:gnl/MRDRNA2_/MRDRNA2_63475_c0_seq2.p1 gnl/MRDRNA2_/MRDRNA2_63475_c0~~gnl/MRDRNA2_/MRDRNA2_63475_c0_seq2.p1  ORF type:complete len:232 (+),score=45.77 gnl/MRDRNA2_/MRDRNA2_63475_c0_seq2:110-805(+)